MVDESRPDDEGTETGTSVADETSEPKVEKLTQAVDIHDAGPCRKHIKVTIDRVSVDKVLDRKFSELVVDANVAGFRPGKAPRKIIERRFNKDVHQQVKGEILLQSLEQLAEDHDIAPLAPPNLNPAKIEIPKDGPLVYEFEVEVRPEFDLPEYKGLKLKRPVRTFTDEDVAREQRRLLAPYGQIIPKPDGKAELGDILVADLVSQDGERKLSESKEIQVRVDTQLAFRDGVAKRFAEQVAGASAGDTRVVDVTLSSSVADPSLQGKSVTTTFQIKDVKSLRLPEMTTEFLNDFGVDSEEEFSELVRALMQRRLEHTQRQEMRKQVMQELAGGSELELPRDLLIRQARKAMARKVMEMRSAGISDDEIRGRQRLLEQDILQSTAQALREHFVLQKIAELEKLDITDDDMEDEIEQIADRTEESPRRVRARLEKEDLLDALAADIIERKALDLILDKAEYTDVPLDQDESTVGTVEEQTVPGEMQDPTAEQSAESAEDEAPKD